MLLFFCYRFPSGLVLYWTAQNILSIVQHLVTNRRLLREEQGGKHSPGTGELAAAKKEQHPKRSGRRSIKRR
jgi:membrane protein insertase Oxa1/YidC/SpoIIIJ